jgi:hypothetical protein
MFLLVFVWQIRDLYVFVSYAISTVVSLIGLFYLKKSLLRGYSSEPEYPDVQERDEESRKNLFYVWLFAVIAIMVTPLLILLLFPQYWLVILNGIVSGAVISELALYVQGN